MKIKEYIKLLQNNNVPFEKQEEALVEIEKAIKEAKQKKEELANKNADLIVSAFKTIEGKLNKKFEELLNTPAMKGEKGDKGDKGDTGPAGKDGLIGRDGKDGKDGRDGVDGKDGVSVVDAYIDFDGSLVIKLSDGNVIDAGKVVSDSIAKEVNNFMSRGEILPLQDGNSGKYLKTVNGQLEWDNIDISTADLSGTLPIVNGGTGATTASQARTNLGLGTIATQNANSVAITGGVIDNTAIGATTPAAGTFTALTATGQTSLGGAAGAEGLRVTPTASGVNWVQVAGCTSTGFSNTIGAEGASTNIQMLYYSKGVNGHVYRTNGSAGATQLVVAHTSSAVNNVQITGAATGGQPTISAQGSDTNIGLNFLTKGTFNYTFQTGGGIQFGIAHAASAVNYIRASGSAAGATPLLTSFGSDTNIALTAQSKGTGAINLAAGSSGVNISNGGTVTAVTLSNRGGGFTSFPSIAISAPTTAGGVQATVSVTGLNVSSMTLNAGGTGYTVNDVLTLSGITGTAPTVRVDTVSGGVITAFTITGFGGGNVQAPIPSNPIGVTGGTGSGASFNVNWNLGNISITNAGSGYVEQPTVTFSGGGGSGAAAYATVGTSTAIRSLGSNLLFLMPGGEPFRIIDGNAPANTFWAAIGASTPYFRAVGGNSAVMETSAAVPILFRTNSGQEQFRVSHTASAVNFVQVTGAATGVQPIISSQGSDANIGMTIRSKGTFACEFQSSAGTVLFQALPVASSVNFCRVVPAVAGSAPVLSSQGSDTNIDLNLTTKGTGAVNLNTGNGTGFRVADLGGAITTGLAVFAGSSAQNTVYLAPFGSSSNSNALLLAKGSGFVALGTNSNNNSTATEQMRVTHTASAVNFVQVTGAATGNTPAISAQGSDANVNLLLNPKGNSQLNVFINGGSQFRVSNTANAVNYLQAVGSIASNAPVLSAQGSDTNIDLALTPKGTGLVRFGTHTATSDVAITGYIEIKDSAGNIRKLAVIT